MLSVDVEKKLGDFSLAMRFEAKGAVTALFGPSGAGKTTLVNMIAGLMTPDRGRITLAIRCCSIHRQGIDIPAHKRRIGYVFQEGRLFPHMTVARNLDYGRRMNGLSLDAAEAGRVIDMLDIRPLLERRPGKLSGGERQRIAIGRALLMRPRLLLLDEPLASLDAKRKSEILPYLERLRDEARVPMVYVSHNAAEIRRIATSVVWLDGGNVTAVRDVEFLDTMRAIDF